MSFKTRLFEVFVSAVIFSFCAAGGIYSCTLAEYTNACSFFIAAPTIVMALRYLSRIARSQEQIAVMRQVATQNRPEAEINLPTQDDGTMEHSAENPFQPPGIQ